MEEGQETRDAPAVKIRDQRRLQRDGRDMVTQPSVGVWRRFGPVLPSIHFTGTHVIYPVPGCPRRHY